MEKWIVFKECSIPGVVLQVGNEIDVVNGCVYYNSCLMDPFYQQIFLNLIAKEKVKNNYLRPGKVIYNKI